MMPHQRKALVGYFCALSHAINRQDLPQLHNPLIPYGLKQGKRVKNPRKNALFFLDTSILLSPMSKNKSYKISKLVSSTTIDPDTIPLHRYPTKLPSLSRVRARAFQQRCWFFAVTSVTLTLSSSSCIGLLLALSHHRFFRSDIDQQTTRCFQQNDTLFSIKRYVVFNKTTRRFSSNIMSFSLLFERIPHIFPNECYKDIANCCSIVFYDEPCDTCDSKKVKTPVMRARARTREGIFKICLRYNFPSQKLPTPSWW